MVDTLFSLVNVVILPFWALMLLLPYWRWTERIIRSPWIVAPSAALYAAGLLLSVTQPPADLSVIANPTAASIAALLGTPFGATVAWAHMVALDLFAGRWEYLEGRRLGITWWLVAPCLFLTLMAGPLGLLLFLILRAVTQRRRPMPVSAEMAV